MGYSVFHCFNPRSYERSDPTSSAITCSICPFQSTLLRKERHLLNPVIPVYWIVSIHAPTKGATMVITLSSIAELCFNPRSYERSDISRTDIGMTLQSFNPRSYERSDIIYAIVGIWVTCFNPRSYERSDFDNYYVSVSGGVSIHAPTKGATLASCSEIIKEICFNPRSYERSDYGSFPIFLMTVVSIHAPTKGATL